MTWWQLTMLVLCVFGFGLIWGVEFGRTIERLRRARTHRRNLLAMRPETDLASLPVTPSPADAIEMPRRLARAEIVMCGQVVRTDLIVSSDMLEQLANGLGKTLVSLQSLERH